MFVEVRVDEDFGTVRVTRVVSAVAAGRIINPKTARSQILGGVVWGIGMALHEETLIDHRLGRFMNHNLAEYHVPVNADIHDIDVIFVEEHDDDRRAARREGLGEIGIVRHRGGDRKRDLSRHRQARPQPADHARQGDGLRTGSRSKSLMPGQVRPDEQGVRRRTPRPSRLTVNALTPRRKE